MAAVLVSSLVSDGSYDCDTSENDLRHDYELLLKCVCKALTPNAEGSSVRLPDEAVHWARFLALAQRHEVLPLVSLGLRDAVPGVPEGVQRWLETQRKSIVARNLSLASELLELLECFRESGLRAVPFKGPALAAALYGNLSLRQIADLDIFIDRRDVLSVLKLLGERGYVLEERFRAMPEEQLYCQHKDLDLAHPVSGAHLELHWSVCEPTFDERMSSTPLWAARSTTKLLDRLVPFPAAEDLLLLLALHGARHRWECLKWVCDIAVLLRAFPEFDWNYALKKAQNLSRRRMLLLAVSLAQELLGLALPAQVLQLIGRDRKLQGLVREVYLRHGFQSAVAPPLSVEAVLEGADSDLFRLRTREGFVDRTKLLAGLLIDRLKPTAEDRRYVSLPRVMAPALWLLRPVRLCFTYGPACILRFSAQLFGGLYRAR
jgi:hypothetical protein